MGFGFWLVCCVFGWFAYYVCFWGFSCFVIVLFTRVYCWICCKFALTSDTCLFCFVIWFWVNGLYLLGFDLGFLFGVGGFGLNFVVICLLFVCLCAVMSGLFWFWCFWYKRIVWFCCLSCLILLRLRFCFADWYFTSCLLVGLFFTCWFTLGFDWCLFIRVYLVRLDLVLWFSELWLGFCCCICWGWCNTGF